MAGRADELERLARLVDAGPGPAIALVGGEAGVGKTRLVRELIDRLPPGWSCSRARPIRARSAARSSCSSTRSGPATPTTTTGSRAWSIPAGRPTSGCAWASRSCATSPRLAPSMVVFDDLHWADSESVALFERLAEQGSGPRLLVGTYRPDALHRRHPTAEMLPGSSAGTRSPTCTSNACRRSRSGRSSPPSTGEPSYRVVEALHARTGGNPFFLEELLAAARKDDPDALLSQELPWSLAELVRTQLDDLSTEQRRVLETAAVLGVTRVDFDLLAAVSGNTDDELIPILRHLVDRGLLVEAEADVFSFRHALARSDRGRPPRTRAPAPAPRRARRAASDRTATTSPRSRTTPAVPASSTTWSRRPVRARSGRCTPDRATRRSSSPSSV